MPSIVLASGSPRRARVLEQLGIPHDIVVPDVDESPRSGEGPAEMAERLARVKAERGARPGWLAFGFDTVVAHRGEILGKPASPADARRMLARLAGEGHDVYSGIAAAADGRLESATERTRVLMRSIAAEEIAAYVATGEPLDKAGGYGIQGAGAALVHGIEGDFFNVMGFPVQRFLDLLSRFGLRYDFRSVRPEEELS